MPQHQDNRYDPRSPRVRRGVIGIVQRNDTFLMIRRAAGVAKGGCWCFPGGHVERGENSRKAIRREFREELGIDIRPTKRIGSVRVGDSRHVLAVWLVCHTGGEIQAAPREVADVCWVREGEIATISPGLPSNHDVLEMIQLHSQAIPPIT